jgi:hypothetical protein
MGKKTGYGSGMNDTDHLSESLETIFLRLKYSNSFMRIRDPGSGMEKLPVLRIHDILVWIRIRGSMPLTNGSGSLTFKMPTEK